jgi:hypothetical protein
MYADENPSNDPISKSPAASIPTQGGPAPLANHVVSVNAIFLPFICISLISLHIF